MTRLAIRGWKKGVRQFEEFHRLRGDGTNERGETLEAMADRHALRLCAGGAAPHLIEIEFLDQPDPLQRFLRFGTDPAGMVNPIRLDRKGEIQ